MIRAKFICDWNDPVTMEENEVRFHAVCNGSEENKKFFKYTPAGQIEMTIAVEVAEKFIVGKEYYLDFTEVEE